MRFFFVAFLSRPPPPLHFWVNCFFLVFKLMISWFCKKLKVMTELYYPCENLKTNRFFVSFTQFFMHDLMSSPSFLSSFLWWLTHTHTYIHTETTHEETQAHTQHAGVMSVIIKNDCRRRFLFIWFATLSSSAVLSLTHSRLFKAGNAHHANKTLTHNNT